MAASGASSSSATMRSTVDNERMARIEARLGPPPPRRLSSGAVPVVTVAHAERRSKLLGAIPESRARDHGRGCLPLSFVHFATPPCDRGHFVVVR